MRSFRLLTIALLTMPLSAAADQTVPVAEALPCATTDEGKTEAHRKEILACWKEWKEKKTPDEVRGRLWDTLFLDQPFASRVSTFFVESMKFSADGGVANTTGRIGGPGQDVNTPARFDQTEWLYSLKIGWADKPILKDLYLLAGDKNCLEDYRFKGRWEDPWRWALLDAVTVNASYSYGSTITDPDGDDNFTTTAKGGYEVKATYSVPLEKLLETFRLAAPLHDE